MIKLEKVATSHNCNFMGGCCFLYLCKNNLQKTPTKAYVCKVIVVLDIYHKIFGIRYAWPPANKIKMLALIKF